MRVRYRAHLTRDKNFVLIGRVIERVRRIGRVFLHFGIRDNRLSGMDRSDPIVKKALNMKKTSNKTPSCIKPPP